MADRAILVADDSADDRFLIERALKKARFACPIRLVAGGEEAVAYLEGNGPYADRGAYPLPDVLVLDLKMPRMSGFDVLRWIRAHPVWRRLPVVVMTSSREAPDIDRAYDLGANSYLVKPLSFDALIEMAKALNLYWYTHNEGPAIGPSAAGPSKERPE